MSLTHFVASALALYFFTFNVVAGDTIYRWIDKKGVTHFSHVKPSDSSISEVEEIVLRNSDTYKPPQELQQNNAASGITPYQKVAQENCDMAQQNFKILSAFKNITQQDKDGNVTQLSAADRNEQLSLANKQIELFCKK